MGNAESNARRERENMEKAVEAVVTVVAATAVALAGWGLTKLAGWGLTKLVTSSASEEDEKTNDEGKLKGYKIRRITFKDSPYDYFPNEKTNEREKMMVVAPGRFENSYQIPSNELEDFRSDSEDEETDEELQSTIVFEACRRDKQISGEKICWRFPGNGKLKMNTDGSVKWRSRKKDGSIRHINPPQAGFGGVIRNESGSLILGFYGRLKDCCGVLDAELWGIYKGLEIIRGFNLSEVEIESDSTSAIHLIKHEKAYKKSPLKELVERCKAMKQETGCTLEHALREGNRVADELAKRGSRDRWKSNATVLHNKFAFKKLSTMATLIAPVNSSPVEDAEAIRKAVHGWGTDEKKIILIIGHRNAVQRKLIRQTYEEIYQENLIKRFESELHGNFEKAMFRWILDPLDRDAVLANVALKQSNPDYHVIVELSCIYSPEELLAVKQAYQARYHHCLEEDLASHISGDLSKFLVALVGVYRYDGGDIDPRLAKSEAGILHNAIKDKNHEEITRIVGTRSKAQLVATFNCYKDEYGASITKHLMNGPANPYLAAVSTAVRCIKDPKKYYEKLLRDALHNHGVDENALTRVIVMRAEKDLKDIKELYYKRNSVTLDHAVAKETSGDYEAFLLTLPGKED